MLRHAFRRLLWVIPSVLGISLVTFFVLSWVPDALAVAPPGVSDGEREARWRARFMHLPLFVNMRPRDLRLRAAEAMAAVADAERGSAQAARGRRELVRLGGAALPYVLPKLDALSPEARVRVALALAPLARRMGIERQEQLDDPQRVVLFWTRFWETRGVEFRQATVASAVRRYALHGSEARAEELRVLDTFALPALIDQLVAPTNRSEAQRARRLIDLMAHATDRADRLTASDDLVAARACVERWQRWWLVYRADYVPLVGVSRIAAVALETRYGKWAYEAVASGFGLDEQGRPILGQLLQRGRISLAVLLLGIAIAYLLAIGLGSLSAVYRGTALDRGIALGVLAPYALSPAVVGMLAIGLGWLPVAGAGEVALGPVLAAAALLALVLLADPTRHQRSSLGPVLAEDYVRAARARGAGPWRVVVVHALRNALFPMVTRVTLELPAALTAVFVLERVFNLPGLGDSTIRAVQRGDSRWLMALAVAAAVWAVVALVLADVGHALLDPRARSAWMRTRRREA